MIRAAIIGAGGYTGVESIEILLRHPEAKVSYLTALPEECMHVADMFGQLRGRLDMMIEPLDLDKLASKADVALCCLPHKVSMSFVPKLLATGIKVIDFSADYRIKNAAVYEKYYEPHTDKENLSHAVYGLPELFRSEIKGARLIANPGCYPTGASLALAPLLKHGLIKTSGIIVSSVTGVSGGGKKPSPNFHFPYMNENIYPYGVGVHRHMPEMEQVASTLAGKTVELLFQPHVGPFDRGILSSTYSDPVGTITADEVMTLYQDFYKGEPFVQVLSKPPAVKHVAKTNYCHIFPTVAKGKIVVFSVIDNLIKGASGQAIQNMNILFGLPETMGLE
ncbi:MAG TPA: N-acetyl-gamma-glutamyl-phosphate reductase [Anaerohalosphaeraceae bacterium]|nr:N-acetyl-gamma-glutamyl-phosphate reductase [Phycisphaerae bacterium]HOK95229.1 N-acetyl-gamma-glutamyl-phosphate reductase [Anaerohalosphaeraceae bacterium]HOL31843.1 N-acetyl-gamma-glutamyl-phosphate reductase [Anaerohalosphaeraceae bacterium]HOM75087.1 N-acetyl-gamma-glutamyl-phosphate reductase [Anaerohalosphaeraceae bacterium]HPC63158.1 N-acetyl-gamma-glutamyl-phosphate reductase [Anaerohalosphaeraceae bacterium]